MHNDAVFDQSVGKTVSASERSTELKVEKKSYSLLNQKHHRCSSSNVSS